jgi:hypothetical protein
MESKETESNPLIEEFERTKTKVCEELARFVAKAREFVDGAEDQYARAYLRYITEGVDLTRHAISQITFMPFGEWYEEHYGIPKATRMFLRFGAPERKQQAADAVTKAMGGDDGS